MGGRTLQAVGKLRNTASRIVGSNDRGFVNVGRFREVHRPVFRRNETQSLACDPFRHRAECRAGVCSASALGGEEEVMHQLKIASAAIATMIVVGVGPADAGHRQRPVVPPWWSHRIISPGSDYFYGRYEYPWYGAISGIYTGDPTICYAPSPNPMWGPTSWRPYRLQFTC
jgi:hypothetical protein